MKIEIELSEKIEKIIPEILTEISKQNNKTVTIEEICSQLIKNQLIQIYSQILGQ